MGQAWRLAWTKVFGTATVPPSITERLTACQSQDPAAHLEIILFCESSSILV